MDKNNKQVDDLLQLLGREISDSRYRRINFDDDDQINRVKVQISKGKKNNAKRKRITRICCIFMCAIIGTLSFSTITSEAFRAKAFGYFFEQKDGYEDLVSEKSEMLYPSYIPKGFKKVSEQEVGTSIDLLYENKSTDEGITISQTFGDGWSLSVDTENTAKEKCLVGSYEAYYYAEEGEGGTHTLMFRGDKAFIEINSTLEKDELIKIG